MLVGGCCLTGGMDKVISEDGTPIAVYRTGAGRPVVLVGGAFSTALAVTDVAEAFAAAGFEAVTYDRRARGDSGDTRPYEPTREVEDLNAVIELVGGHAAVLGHSSGAVLALVSASQGSPIDHVFLSEPPFRFGEEMPDPALAERLQRHVDEGEPELAVREFQLEGVGLPEPVVDQIRDSPMFPGLVAVAQSVVYDTVLTTEFATPTEAMRAVAPPVTILRGAQTFPFLIAAADRLASLLPGAELVVVEESREHRLDGPATAAVLRARLG